MSTSQAGSAESLSQVARESEGVALRVGGAGRLGGNGKLEVAAEALRILPAEFVKRHRVLPLRIENGTIHVATAEPGNQRVIDDIRLLSGFEVQEQEASAGEVLEKIAECYQVTVEQMIE